MKQNHFVHRIDKEEINKMPVVSFEGEVIIVRTQEMVKEAVEYLSKHAYIGIDTETRPSFVHGVHYPTALVQLSTLERCYLFQLNHIGLPVELAKLFSNDKVCKVGLALRDDWRGLYHLRRFTPKNYVDLQNVVPTYGILNLGLQKIFAILFGQKISKSQQLTNWANDVLTDDQARYASTDAWAALKIYLELLNTKPLPVKEYMALKEADRQLQIQHQQEIEARNKEQFVNKEQGARNKDSLLL